jgi:hypothetical protein
VYCTGFLALAGFAVAGTAFIVARLSPCAIRPRRTDPFDQPVDHASVKNMPRALTLAEAPAHVPEKWTLISGLPRSALNIAQVGHS